VSQLPSPPPIPGSESGTLKLPGIAPSRSSVINESPVAVSPLPLLVAIGLLVISSLIQVFKFQLAANFWFEIGYVLTPLLSTLTLGWDSVLQRNGRKNPWFVVSPKITFFTRIAVGMGFAIGALHILEIARFCGQTFVQSGAFCV
jgi:hypothetical protein